MVFKKHSFNLSQEKHKTIHIVSFDVPYPPNYGGVIDVFYKIKALHQAGIKIKLHCFEYGRGVKKELEEFCESVHYYPRKTGFLNHLSMTPFIIKSRQSQELLKNLLENPAPILMEGLHTCSLLYEEQLKTRIKIFRESNIEHEYYYHLASSEKNLLKKIYFKIEAFKLKHFEKIVEKATLILPVSKEDTNYFKTNYPATKTEYLPSFHGNSQVKSIPGSSDYILYHGNLMVSENVVAAEYLIKEVFSKINHKVIIAGLNPPDSLEKLISTFSHIELKANPEQIEMESLISNAQINCLYTFQATGLKLKLVNVLYTGRWCLCNSLMLHGTGLNNSCSIADSSQELIAKINQLMKTEFSSEVIRIREKELQPYHDHFKTEKLVALIFNE